MKVARSATVWISRRLPSTAAIGGSHAEVKPSFAASRILEVHGERMIKRTFDPGFRIDLHRKDLNLALEGAKALNLALPATALAQQLFGACAANGAGGLDHSALVRALEIMANHQVAEG